MWFSLSLFISSLLWNWTEAEKQGQREKGAVKEMDAVHCGAYKTAAFHLDSESVKEKKISTLIPLFHVPAIRLACMPRPTPGRQWKLPWQHKESLYRLEAFCVKTLCAKC